MIYFSPPKHKEAHPSLPSSFLMFPPVLQRDHKTKKHLVFCWYSVRIAKLKGEDVSSWEGDPSVNYEGVLKNEILFL